MTRSRSKRSAGSGCVQRLVEQERERPLERIFCAFAGWA